MFSNTETFQYYPGPVFSIWFLYKLNLIGCKSKTKWPEERQIPQKEEKPKERKERKKEKSIIEVSCTKSRVFGETQKTIRDLSSSRPFLISPGPTFTK